MIFELLQDFSSVLDSLPIEHDRRDLLQLLKNSLSTSNTAQIIKRHPTITFQFIWNQTVWMTELVPEEQRVSVMPGLTNLLSSWRNAKEQLFPGFCWVRAIRPRVSGPYSDAFFAPARGYISSVPILMSLDGSAIGVEADEGIEAWSAVTGMPIENTATLQFAEPHYSYDAKTGVLYYVLGEYVQKHGFYVTLEFVEPWYESAVAWVARKEPIAWFDEVDHHAGHPSGRIWAGKCGNQLCIYKLEGAAEISATIP